MTAQEIKEEINLLSIEEIEDIIDFCEALVKSLRNDLLNKE